MLKIKLTRLGKKKEPRYRIVVNEARDKRDGLYVACLGHYQPAEKPKVLELDIKAYEAWTAQGAQPTATVAWLYEQAKNGKGLPEKKNPKLSKKARAKLAAEAEKKAEETAAAAEEEAKSAEEAEGSQAESTPVNEVVDEKTSTEETASETQQSAD